jgi:Uma2 family endonuclease
MGNLATPEFLIARWAELCRDPSLENLPYKIELNASGKIEMSPAGNRHGRLQGALALQLGRQLPDGQIMSECSIFTRIGIRVADIAWASHEFMAAFGEITPYMGAPEICVEVASLSNPKGELEEKTQAYLAAGAREAWIVALDGSIRYFTSAGEQPKSRFPVTVSLPPPIK